MSSSDFSVYRTTANRPIVCHVTKAVEGHLPGVGRLEGSLRDAQRFKGGLQPLLANIGPNWFASVMGTAIVAHAAAGLPVHAPLLRPAATVVWALAACWLVTVSAAFAGHWLRHRAAWRGHAGNPVMAHFWGAPPMALLAVGAGTLSLGRDWLGPDTALAAAWTLWLAGTALGLFTTVWIPYRMLTAHRIEPDSAFAGWLMPVVPPMVSAAGGAALIPHLGSAQAKLTLLVLCYACFGVSLLFTMILLPVIWLRLVRHKTGAAAQVPTLWIVLGPLGQSTTAAGLLGDVAPDVLPAPYGAAARAFGVLYGVPVMGFALIWLALAAAITARTARSGLPFALTWWSFTFPVGTCVTGASVLARHLGSTLLTGISVALYGFLVLAWLTVAARTCHGIRRRTLL